MINHQKYIPSAEELNFELSFMYKKYAELCKAYKSLAEKKMEGSTIKTVNDMSHMKFKDEGVM
jgi:hypothetical protein